MPSLMKIHPGVLEISCLRGKNSIFWPGLSGLPTLTHWAWDSRISPHFTWISHSHAYMEISHAKNKNKNEFLFFLLLLVRGLWCTKGTTMCLLCENGCQNFWGQKKSDGVPPPPPHQLFWDLRDIYRLRADGPRISHAEPSSKVGSPEFIDLWPWADIGQNLISSSTPHGAPLC